MNDPRRRQVTFNASSRDQWGGFTDHRRRVTELLGVGAKPERSRLCILGAGNCNDLDLPALLQAHREVHLVDVDSMALAQGVARQGVADHPSLHRFEGVDLTGMVDAIAAWTPTTPILPEDLKALAEHPSRLVGPTLSGPFDIVASTCLLSPLIGNAFHSVGEAHPQFMAIVQAIRLGHLRLLTQLAAPGGTAILITDVVSSVTLPGLESIPESSLPELFPRLVRDRNYFHGVNPEALWSLSEQDPILNARVAGRESVGLWRWKLHDRLYLVWAIRYRVHVAKILDAP